MFMLSGLGLSYASFTDSINITGTATLGTLYWGFVRNSHTQKSDDPDWNCFWNLINGFRSNGDPIWYPDPKNVAKTTIDFGPGEYPRTMTMTIEKAYPYYYEHIAFVAQCYGTIPLRIRNANIIVDGNIITTLSHSGFRYINLDGQPGADIQIWWGDGWGAQMHSGDRHDFSFEILVLQPCPQGSILTFDIEIVGVQWDKY